MSTKSISIIAEAGINHSGDVELAKKLIDMAIVAGCDAVKFQKRTPDICVPEKIEFGEIEFNIIANYCDQKILLRHR